MFKSLIFAQAIVASLTGAVELEQAALPAGSIVPDAEYCCQIYTEPNF